MFNTSISITGIKVSLGSD